MIEKGQILRPILALHITNRLFLRITSQPSFPVLLPHLHRVVPVCIIRLPARYLRHRLPLRLLRFLRLALSRRNYLYRETLVVGAWCPLQFVHASEAARGDRVELPVDRTTRPGNVEEERDPVWPAHKRVFSGAAIGSDEGSVAGADKVLKKRVVGESSLEGSVGEY